MTVQTLPRRRKQALQSLPQTTPGLSTTATSDARWPCHGRHVSWSEPAQAHRPTGQDDSQEGAAGSMGDQKAALAREEENAES